MGKNLLTIGGFSDYLINEVTELKNPFLIYFSIGNYICCGNEKIKDSYDLIYNL
jgi:hypothetical protein